MDEPISKIFREDLEINRTFPKGSFPNVNQIKRKAELYFVNSDPLLEFNGREIPSNLIYVGGAHIDQPKPLFEVKTYSDFSLSHPLFEKGRAGQCRTELATQN